QTGNQSSLQMMRQLERLESGADMHISNGIGRENQIDQIVYFTGKTRQFYQAMSPYELAVELKIVKIQAGLV
ncbi:hypothetical protein, partial [Streptococcus suis]